MNLVAERGEQHRDEKPEHRSQRSSAGVAAAAVSGCVRASVRSAQMMPSVASASAMLDSAKGNFGSVSRSVDRQVRCDRTRHAQPEERQRREPRHLRRAAYLPSSMSGGARSAEELAVHEKREQEKEPRHALRRRERQQQKREAREQRYAENGVAEAAEHARHAIGCDPIAKSMNTKMIWSSSRM